MFEYGLNRPQLFVLVQDLLKTSVYDDRAIVHGMSHGRASQNDTVQDSDLDASFDPLCQGFQNAISL